MSRINKTAAIIIVVFCLLLVVAIAFVQIYFPHLKNLALIGYLISTLLMMYTIQNFIYNYFQKRRYKNIKTLKYTINSFDLEAKGFINRKMKFGSSYILVDNEVVYRVNVIDNYQLYFQEDKNSIKMSNALKEKINSCKKMVSYDLFKSIDEEHIKKIIDINQLEGKILINLFFYYDQRQDCFLMPNFKETSSNFSNERAYLESLIEMNQIE